MSISMCVLFFQEKCSQIIVLVVVTCLLLSFCVYGDCTYYDILSQAERTIDMKYPQGNIANQTAKKELLKIVESNCSEAEKILLIKKKFLHLGAREIAQSNVTMESSVISRIRIFQEEFKSYLLGDKGLLLAGGAKMVEIHQRKYIIIAVGMTSTKGKSLMKIRNDVKDKPFEELARFFCGTENFSSREMQEDLEIIADKNERKVNVKDISRNKSVSVSKGHFHGYSVVGEWYSLDGEFFYQAIGKVVTSKTDL